MNQSTTNTTTASAATAAEGASWSPDASRIRKLTAAERAMYDEQGFVEVPDVFGCDELTAIKAEIERLRREKNEGRLDGFGSNTLLKLGLRSPITAAICADERILTLIEDIVQPGIAIYSAKMVEKLPHDESVCHWHQDNAYYNQLAQSSCRMSIWLPLQDVNEENGCLWVVPGSHRHEVQPYGQLGSGHCSLAFADGKADVDGAVPYPMKAGGLLLFHANLFHRSLGNRTNQHRNTFIVSYQEATCPKGNADQHKVLRPA